MNTSLAEIVTKITSQGKNPDVSFLKDDPKAQTMLLMALLSSVNAKNNGQNGSGQIETDKRKYESVSSPSSSPSPPRAESESPRRVGRKPVTSDDDDSDNPKSKRKAQNRAAQRAFRERKENHVRVLEERVKELEDMNEDKNLELQHENEKLKEMVAKLKYENEALLGASSSFDFPLSNNSVTSDSSRPNKLIRSSVNNNDDVYFDTFSSSNLSRSSNSNTPETQHQLNIDDILGLDTSILPSDALLDHSELLGFSNDYSGQLNDMLDQHRLTFATNPSDFDFFYPLPTHNHDILDTASIQLPADHEGEKHVHDITKVWDKLSQHPRFDEVDMDILCDEMKKKAVCVDLDLNEEIEKVVNKFYPV